DKAAAILPRWRMLSVPDEQIQKFSQGIARRQIDRLWVVGSNETTADVIEQSYVRFLQLFEAHLGGAPYCLGRRPASCDFALYGQLTQLAHFDPTPMALTLEHGPRVAAWVDIVEDLSGTRVSDDDWITRDTVPDTLRALLVEVGRVYVPAMLGNAAAIASGSERVECEVDGRKWVQKPFPYQAKCLAWLRESYRGLAEGDRVAVDGLLSGTGCEALFA
ncbi:MAG: glutathione S-transferase family protein, partial [Planctomycetota bacterium]